MILADTLYKNMHDLACLSRIAAAYCLGAEYIQFDDFTEDFFSKYLLLSYRDEYQPSKGKQLLEAVSPRAYSRE